MRRGPTLAAMLTIAAGAVAPTSSARAASPVIVTFASTGAEQQWSVPLGLTSVHVVLVGATGGAGVGGNPGGFGQVATADLQVTPGTTWYVEVGGNGGDGTALSATGHGGAGGFNHGAAGGYSSFGGAGGGGGMSSIQLDSGIGSPGNTIIAAGGGGGGGAGSGGGGGGAGGESGSDSSSGGGGGQVAAGPFVDAPSGTGIAALSPTPEDGTNYRGGWGATYCSSSVNCEVIDAGAGGGGGGGKIGGSGGGGGSTSGGGGGGGLSYVADTTVGLSLSADTTGTSSVTISYSASGGGGGSETGTVAVQFSVIAAAACIELSTTSVDFGSVALGSENVAGSPSITVTNCGTTSEALLAQGSDATASGATWSLIGSSATCADTLGLNNYRLELESPSGTVALSSSNKTLQTLDVGASGSHTARLTTACPGSDGGGQLMTTQIVFTATSGG